MNTTKTEAPVLCIGYLTDEHACPEADLRTSLLCSVCDEDAYQGRKVTADRVAAYLARTGRSTSTWCPAGGHKLGSRYYTCDHCYGD